MGRPLAISGGSEKHLMHVGGDKHLGVDPDCDDEGHDVTAEGCSELFSSSNPRILGLYDSYWNFIGLQEYGCPSSEIREENIPTTCWGEHIPCVWEMEISGVEPIDNYYEKTDECDNGSFMNTTTTPTGEERPPGKYHCFECDAYDQALAGSGVYGFNTAPEYWWHSKSHYSYAGHLDAPGAEIGRRRPTANINGKYIISTHQTDYGGAHGWSRNDQHWSSKRLVSLDKDGITASTVPSPDWSMRAHIYFYNCSGGFNFGDTEETYNKVNPTRYEMKDGVHLFLLFGDGTGAMNGNTRSGSKYSSRNSTCGYEAANVFAGHVSNFSCLGTNQFTNEIFGVYEYDDRIPKEGVAQLDRVVVPYYVGGSITLRPMPDDWYSVAAMEENDVWYPP